MLLKLGGHLFVTHFTNRWFALRAVEAAFKLKAEHPDLGSVAERNGYAAAVYGLISPMFSWPGIKDFGHAEPLELARRLPGLIWQAFGALEPNSANPVEQDAMRAASQKAAQSAKRLLDVGLPDPDAIFAPYLKGIPEQSRCGGVLIVTDRCGKLDAKSGPNCSRRRRRFKKRSMEVWKAGENEPSRKNLEQMMQIALAICRYAQEHDQTLCPDNLDVYFPRTGMLKPSVQNKSLLTGKAYVYLAAGEKAPAKFNDRAGFVLIHDDQLIPGLDAYYYASALCWEEASKLKAILRNSLQGEGGNLLVGQPPPWSKPRFSARIKTRKGKENEICAQPRSFHKSKLSHSNDLDGNRF